MQQRTLSPKRWRRQTEWQGKLHGRQIGYGKGWQAGYRLGQCQMIEQQHTQHEPIADCKVIYVCAGISEPYPALDQAIIAGLQQVVSQVIVTNPTEDVVALGIREQPDIVIVLNGLVLPDIQVMGLRERGIKTVVWFADDPYYTEWTAGIAPRYDYVFTLEQSCVAFYQSIGCQHVHHLPFAVNAQLFRPKRVDAAYDYDICFIGTAFSNRLQLFDAIAPYLKDKKVMISGWWWDRLQHYAQIRHLINLGMWLSAEETASYYNGAKVVINLHRLADDDEVNYNEPGLPAWSLNPRCYEIAGCATLQLTDTRQQLPEHYIPGQEIVTYKGADDLIQHIEYYLHHEEERRRIALGAYARTCREHTYRHRLQKMLQVTGVL